MNEFSELDEHVNNSIQFGRCSIKGCGKRCRELYVYLYADSEDGARFWLKNVCINSQRVWTPDYVHLIRRVHHMYMAIIVCEKHFEDWADGQDRKMVGKEIKPHKTLFRGTDY